MTERYESRASTHADDCWGWGPKHYECAVREIKALRAEVEGWKEQHARDSAELRRICQHRDEYKARAERLAEALRDAHEALADAANTMYVILGESQFCDCSAFERANQWRQDWHGGDPLLQQITAALEQESNDA